MGAPLALQWLRLVLPMQGAGIQFLVKKLQSHIPHGITKKIKIKKKIALTTGTSLAVWWLRLWASTIGGTGSIPVQTKKKWKKKKRKKEVWLSGLVPILNTSIHNSYSCIPLQKTFTDSLYYIVAVSVLKYYPPKKGRGKVYSHHGRLSDPGNTLARLWHLTSCVSPSAKWG